MKENIKKIIYSLIATILIIVFAMLGMFFYKKAVKKQNPNDIVAMSKYGNVYQKDIKNYITNLETFFSKQIDPSKLTKEEVNLVINELINRKKILKDAKDGNIKNSEKYKEKLANLQDELLVEVYLEDLISKKITENKLIEEYKKEKELLKDKTEYKVKHILVEKEEDIKKVKNELLTNSFEEVAKKYSIDGSAKQGGDLGYVIEGQTVKDFEDQIRKATINKVSNPFKTEFGWHVLLKEDERKAKVPPFKDVKSALKNKLTTEVIKKYREENLKNAEIRLIEEVK